MECYMAEMQHKRAFKRAWAIMLRTILLRGDISPNHGPNGDRSGEGECSLEGPAARPEHAAIAGDIGGTGALIIGDVDVGDMGVCKGAGWRISVGLRKERALHAYRDTPLIRTEIAFGRGSDFHSYLLLCATGRFCRSIPDGGNRVVCVNTTPFGAIGATGIGRGAWALFDAKEK